MEVSVKTSCSCKPASVASRCVLSAVSVSSHAALSTGPCHSAAVVAAAATVAGARRPAAPQEPFDSSRYAHRQGRLTLQLPEGATNLRMKLRAHEEFVFGTAFSPDFDTIPGRAGGRGCRQQQGDRHSCGPEGGGVSPACNCLPPRSRGTAVVPQHDDAALSGIDSRK
jgi:hypothetical protein